MNLRADLGIRLALHRPISYPAARGTSPSRVVSWGKWRWLYKQGTHLLTQVWFCKFACLLASPFWPAPLIIWLWVMHGIPYLHNIPTFCPRQSCSWSRTTVCRCSLKYTWHTSRCRKWMANDSNCRLHFHHTIDNNLEKKENSRWFIDIFPFCLSFYLLRFLFSFVLTWAKPPLLIYVILSSCGTPSETSLCSDAAMLIYIPVSERESATCTIGRAAVSRNTACKYTRYSSKTWKIYI